MADNLIFPIKFDLEAAVKEAQGDADRLLRRLQTTINAKPLAVNLKIPGAGSGSINEINGRLKELVKQWNNLTEAQRITNKTTGQYTAEAKKILAEYTRLRGASESYAQSLKQIDSAAKKAAKQQEKLAESAYRGSNAFKNQDGYVSRLVKRLAVYASFQYTSQFLTNIREVTAQFELQRISLGAIIQDQQKANQIFAEIKSFALTSPLKILDLTKYAKQVAAYGFAADRVFDVTKRLADISVGLGVDMGRLTLAVSQIKAATVLKASELRQLTETGLPMLDLLSKKLTETQGKLVSAADVMDLISKRAISYEMVEEILYDLTDAGGMFYNMQVKQSQTLFGMWSKLGDAAAIMYDQIGNTSSINAGMKLAIRSIESMMRNWKTTARVLDSVAVAMAVYIVGLKNAAIASKALTSAVALENLAHQQQIIRTPKIIAGIIGINNAKKISTLLTNLHTKAVLSEAAATNVFTKGFWKLTAAMLANPWVAVASAIALVGVALFHFIGNTETAAERAEKLNNSVASLKNLDDTTKPLIDTYNELINKTERTAEEQKKLSEVTHELAKQYPGAITAIGNFGAEVELAADKLNQLYQAEKQARMDNTRYELGETEKKIKEVEAEIEKYQQQLASGEKTIYKRLGDSGLRTKKVVPLTEEDKGDILKRIDELRYGEDGMSGLFGLQQSAEAARRALGLLPSEAAQAVEKFGAWKKTFTTFRKQVGDVRVQLFDDSTIAQFGSLEEALKKTAEEYKKNIALVATYDETLKSATLTSEERAKIETERAEADAMANLAEKALKYYNAMSLLNTSTSGRGRGGSKSDNRLQNLQEIEQTLTKINQKYDELAKKEGQTKALEDINKLYANTLKYVNKLGKQFKLTFKMPTEFKDLQDYRKAILDVINKLRMKGYEKAALDLEEKIGTGNLDALQKDIEKQLKELADKISRTKTAKEFYDKVLGMTGDYDLAAKVSLSIYGDTGYDLQKQLAEQVRQYFQNDRVNIEIPVDVITADNRINYKRLGEFAEQMKEKLGEEPYKAIRKIAEEGQKDLAKTYEGYLKDLEKAKAYADKRVELARTTAAKIREIESNPQYTKEQKAELKRGYLERENREEAKLEWEAFKDMPLYVQMFEDLEHTATSTLTRMKNHLTGLRGLWGSALDPSQIKEIQGRIEEIEKQLAARNPWKALKTSWENYKDALKSYDPDEALKGVAKATEELYNAQTDYGDGSAQVKMAEEELGVRRKLLEMSRRLTDENGRRLKGTKALVAMAERASHNQLVAQQELNEAVADERDAIEKYGVDSDQYKAAHAVVEEKETELGIAVKVSQITQENADTATKWKAAIASAASEITKYMTMTSDLARSMADLTEAFGGSEEDVQYWNDIADGLGKVSEGFSDLMQNILSLNISGIISSAITTVPKMIIGFMNIFSAGKVKRTNKEIKRQQELLEQLEYTYSRLEETADKAFGADFINNFKQRQQTLEKQAEAYRKQYEAELDKGKKADEEKLKEYQQKYRDTLDEIADMQGKIAERMTGTDVASAAKDFANAWLEAYASFGNTAGAIKEKFNDMIKNMVVESVMAKTVQMALQPMFDEMNRMYKRGTSMTDVLTYAFSEAETLTDRISVGLAANAKHLQSLGINIRDLYASSDNLKGVSKNVAGATSEEILQLSGFVNTGLYYLSPIPRIDENLARVLAVIEGRGASAIPQPTSAGWTDWQQQAMDNYNAIARNTADTVVECRRAAEACERIASTFKVKGSTKGLNVFLNS